MMEDFAMTNPITKSTVLVTGATGFIAMHTIVRLLQAGYRVRGTLRSPEREATLRNALAKHVELRDRLELCQADLTSDEGWALAARGCDFVLHVASPLPRKPPRHEDELIVPAREGTLRVLRAAKAAGVKRVVMTSSVAAILYGHDRGGRVFDEEDWTDLTGNVGAYEKSKTLAERAAWDFVRSEAPDLEFVTINPGLVLGPILDADYGTSGEVVRKLLAREIPGCPDVGWAVVDVRDVADAHVSAMISKDAPGKRFVCAIEHASMRDVATILQQNFSARGYRVPTRRLPNWMMKAVSIFDRTVRLALPDLGQRQELSNRRIVETLNWRPRSLREMVVDMGESLIEQGVV